MISTFKELLAEAFEAGLELGNNIEMGLKEVDFNEWYEKRFVKKTFELKENKNYKNLDTPL